MNARTVFLTAACVCLLFATAHADPFQQGDVFGSVGQGKVKVFRPDGTLVQTLDTLLFSNETTGSAFDSSGNFYVTSFGRSDMSKFDNNGVLQLPNPFATNDTNSHNESVVFDLAGNMYIGQADGTKDVIKRDATGAFVARYDVATGNRGSDWIDLAADQRTLYYTSEGRVIRRYDVVADVQLTDFATLPGGGNSFALRLLADGGLIVADRSNVKRLNSAGAVVQTYDATGEDFFFAMNLDPDGTSFWTAGYSTGDIYRFDIATGTLLTTFDSNKFTTLAGLSVFGEITQGTGGQTIIPEPSTVALLAFAGVGVLVVRRRKKRTA